MLERTLHRNLTDEYFKGKAGGELYEGRFISGNVSAFVRGSAVEIRIDWATLDPPVSRVHWRHGAGEAHCVTLLR